MLTGGLRERLYLEMWPFTMRYVEANMRRACRAESATSAPLGTRCSWSEPVEYMEGVCDKEAEWDDWESEPD